MQIKKPLKKPSYEMWEDLPEDKKRKAPALSKFFRGFSELNPVLRECLERAYHTKTMRVKQKQIWHCYQCGAFGGFLGNHRPDGGYRIRFRTKTFIPGYIVNETKADHFSEGLFCEKCAITILPKLQTLCEQRNIKFSVRTFHLNQTWKEQYLSCHKP